MRFPARPAFRRPAAAEGITNRAEKGRRLLFGRFTRKMKIAPRGRPRRPLLQQVRVEDLDGPRRPSPPEGEGCGVAASRRQSAAESRGQRLPHSLHRRDRPRDAGKCYPVSKNTPVSPATPRAAPRASPTPGVTVSLRRARQKIRPGPGRPRLPTARGVAWRCCPPLGVAVASLAGLGDASVKQSPIFSLTHVTHRT